MLLGAVSARLICQRLVVLEAVRLVADEQVAGGLAAKLLGVQPERLVRHDQHLQRMSACTCGALSQSWFTKLQTEYGGGRADAAASLAPRSLTCLRWGLGSPAECMACVHGVLVTRGARAWKGLRGLRNCAMLCTTSSREDSHSGRVRTRPCTPAKAVSWPCPAVSNEEEMCSRQCFARSNYL